MLKVFTPCKEHVEELSLIARTSFWESHGNSAAKEDIDHYVQNNLQEAHFMKALENPSVHFRVACYDNKPAGYLKINLNTPNPKLNSNQICKLERLYVLEEFYDKKIGLLLLDACKNICTQYLQEGIWLYVWTENVRALNFYKKAGFEIIGHTYFKISETHSNPNYWLYLSKDKF